MEAAMSSISTARTPEQHGFGQRDMVARSLHLEGDTTERRNSYPLWSRTVKAAVVAPKAKSA
jgi:hypothetical protein